jgi:hypothetical protein
LTPLPLSHSLTASLSRTRNALETTGAGDHEIAHTLALAEPERRGLTARSEDLIAALRPADREDVKRRIAKLFGMSNFVVGMDAETAADLVGDYAKVMATQPLWAVDSACRSVIASGAKFRPGAPELLAMARRASDPFRTELVSINSVLNARVYRVPDQSERQRVKALFEGVKAMFGFEQPAARGSQADYAAHADALGEASRASPLVLSESARETMRR